MHSIQNVPSTPTNPDRILMKIPIFIQKENNTKMNIQEQGV